MELVVHLGVGLQWDHISGRISLSIFVTLPVFVTLSVFVTLPVFVTKCARKLLTPHPCADAAQRAEAATHYDGGCDGARHDLAPVGAQRAFVVFWVEAPAER